MSGLGDLSPHVGPGHAPATPPHQGPLDDIYGSAPGSPLFAGLDAPGVDDARERTHEILSDLPSRQRALDTDAYREGLSNSKGHHVQQGFDEGYSLGAHVGVQAGYVLGVVQGFVAACKGRGDSLYRETRDVYNTAQKELAMQELLGHQWMTEEGIWNWEVHGAQEDPTFREVAEQHPVVRKWSAAVNDMASKWGVDLEAVEQMHGSDAAEQS